MEWTRKNNVDRFTGFSHLYDQNRPHAPKEIINILTSYLQNKPKLVVDVGCGTGLSSFIWTMAAEKIIGVEPNDDMRNIALKRWKAENKPHNLTFVKALSHQLDIPSNSADIITCSQSFHWMDPQPTLKEFARVLRPNGIFAAYDCDWPPTFDWDIEKHYLQLVSYADQRLLELLPEKEQAHKWNKENHLMEMKKSNLFTFTKEIVFHNWETCDGERYANIAVSQGGIQTALKFEDKEVETAYQEYREHVLERFEGKNHDILFSYRMRLGITK